MFNLNRLSDQQLDQILQRAKAGDNQVLQSLGLYSPIPLLSEKMRRNSMRQAQAAQSAPAQQPTVADKIAGVGSLPVPGVMREENFADGGIVAFAKGSTVPSQEALDSRLLTERERMVKELEDQITDLRETHGPAPTQMTPEERLAYGAKAYGQAQEFDRPYREKMEAMLAQQAPDTEGRKKDEFNKAMLNASLALMGGRGKGFSGFVSDVGGAARVGVQGYEAGMDAVRKAEEEHKKSLLLGEKYKYEMSKGNKKLADEAMDASNVAEQNAIRLHRAGQTEIAKARAAGMQNIGSTISSLERTERDRLNAEINSRKNDIAERKLEAMMAGIISGGGRGGGGGGGKESAAMQREMRQQMAKIINTKDHPVRVGLQQTIKNDPGFSSLSAAQKRYALGPGLEQVLPQYAAKYVEQNFGSEPYPRASESRAKVAGPAPSAPPPGANRVYNFNDLLK
jgi:hypothetical protein